MSGEKERKDFGEHYIEQNKGLREERILHTIFVIKKCVYLIHYCKIFVLF